jgi:transposase
LKSRAVLIRQGLRFLRLGLPGILATQTDVLSPRMLRLIEDLAGDWRHLDARIEGITSEIETLARQDQHCERLMTVPGIEPIISSAILAKSAIHCRFVDRFAGSRAPSLVYFLAPCAR